MTLAEAKSVFAVLMQKARTDTLTERDRQRLTQARQLLRRAKRPAMNPRQSKYVVGDTVYVNRSQVAPSLAKDLFWRVFIDPAVIRQISKDKSRVEIEFPFGKRYWFDVDAIEFKNPTRSEMYVVRWGSGRWEEKTFQTLQAARNFKRRHYPNAKLLRVPKGKSQSREDWEETNPRASILRLGRATEVRYKREVGRKPGFYKHLIESRKAGVYTIPAGWVYVSGKSILISESTPRGRR